MKQLAWPVLVVGSAALLAWFASAASDTTPPAKVAAKATIAFGQPVRVRGNELPQVAGFHIHDWNGDGQPDIFGTCGGLQIFEVCHTRKGKTGRGIDHGLIFPPNLTEVISTRSNLQGPVFAHWTWVGDWFNSGKLDILLSSRTVLLLRNRGDRKSPIFIDGVDLEGTAEFKKLVNNPAPPDGVLLQAVFGDWDGDGRKDLLVVRQTFPRAGRPQSVLYFCKNVGKDDVPRFADPKKIKFRDGTTVSLEGPSLADIDGSGKLALLFTSVNCELRNRDINWVTDPRVVLCRRGDNPLLLDAPVTLTTRDKKPILGGIQAQWVDWEGNGKPGLMVLDPSPSRIRWYPNRAGKGKAPLAR